jgi:hypothetical protein
VACPLQAYAKDLAHLKAIRPELGVQAAGIRPPWKAGPQGAAGDAGARGSEAAPPPTTASTAGASAAADDVAYRAQNAMRKLLLHELEESERARNPSWVTAGSAQAWAVLSSNEEVLLKRSVDQGCLWVHC